MKRITRRGALAGALLTGFLLLAGGRQILARESGAEIVVDVAPVDPRDIFFGHYIILAYPAERIDVGTVEITGGLEAGDPVWVRMVAGEDGIWTPDAVLASRPQDGAIALRGRFERQVRMTNVPGSVPGGAEVSGEAPPDLETFEAVRLDLDLPDRYYASRDTAKVLDSRRRDGELQVILSVRKNGSAALKGLVIDGEPEYDRLF